MTDAPAKGQHRIRENIDALAIAVVMAILMKYFAIEAYQIPTSSMQPTMMGSKEAGVHDRILVDKARYLLVEPQRWDIAVFRYPLRLIQNYVKRIVGLPGERLRIAGGNLYRVPAGAEPTDAAALEVLRRPEDVQEQHWKEIFPARAVLHGEAQPLLGAFRGTGGEWSTDDGVFTVRQRNERTNSSLIFESTKDLGLTNRVFDGYPTWVARAMIDGGAQSGFEHVQDARIGFRVQPQRPGAELRIELEIDHAGGGGYSFVLGAADGEGRIVVEQGNGRPVAQSEPFALPLIAGDWLPVRFAHLDDMCYAWVADRPVAELDCSAFRTLEPLNPRSDGGGGRATLRVQVRGGDVVAFDQLRVERDLHYLPTSRPGEGGIRVFEIPPDHYFMMGDNTQQSVDSRDWTAITVAVDDAGNLVDPAKNPDARRVRGNLRAVPIGAAPDPDENPIVVPSENAIVFSDELGQVRRLHGEVAIGLDEGQMYGEGGAWFAGPEGPFKPPLENEHFVPRDHIIGRPLITFWPPWPWFRLGFIE